MSKYDVYNTQVRNVLNWIDSDEVAIPEIQRPFVWNATKVRDLMDSLYKGYPVGYLIIWKNPDIVLKDGSISKGKKILIDGQQRVTAMEAAIAGLPIIDKNYKKKRIQIAFNPIEEVFEVSNPAIKKDVTWIADISEIFAADYSQWSFVAKYCEMNELLGKEDFIASRIQALESIKNINIGVIELSDTLSIEEVTDVFIRINSQGVVLSQADFAMSKISSDSLYDGTNIRKTIDYFCHFWERPMDHEQILANDTEFQETEIYRKISWVVGESQDIYIPSYSDVLRVAFTYKFKRGRISDLVSLLSGRDFKTRENHESIAEDSFSKLKDGVFDYVNETNFKRFIMIVKSTGIIDKSLVRSKNVLNFGYVFYLLLREKGIPAHIIEKVVRKWIVLSILTTRYSSSPESSFDYDVKRFDTSNPEEYLRMTEEGELSDAYWNNVLVNNLNTSVRSSPYFNVFVMAQVKNSARGFLSEQIDVPTLVEQRGDIHHIFPKKFLQNSGFSNQRDYNQVANYVYTQSEINIKIGANSPKVYMSKMLEQVHGGNQSFGGISSQEDLERNLEENCVPVEFINMDESDYLNFLNLRRKLMSDYIRKYYYSL
jgi:hypothetical protein